MSRSHVSHGNAVWLRCSRLQFMTAASDAGAVRCPAAHGHQRRGKFSFTVTHFSC